MMSNLETLTSKSSEDILKEGDLEKAEPHSPQPIRCTPDLVQDLPLVDNTSDSSPVGSYKESHMRLSPPARLSQNPPVAPVPNQSFKAAAGTTRTLPLEPESAAETFANSDGTIVRIKSTSEIQKPQTNVKFITASFAKPTELSSFKRTLSTSSTGAPKEESIPTPSETSKLTLNTSNSRMSTVTGKAIQVRAPSIPTHLDLVSGRKSASPLSGVTDSESAGSKSLPSTPAVQSNPHFTAMSASTTLSPTPVRLSTASSAELLSTGLQKFRKPPPPIKAKPKPPQAAPKPKKTT